MPGGRACQRRFAVAFFFDVAFFADVDFFFDVEAFTLDFFFEADAFALDFRFDDDTLPLVRFALAVRAFAERDEPARAVRERAALEREERLLAALAERDLRDSRAVGWFQPTARSARNAAGIASGSP